MRLIAHGKVNWTLSVLGQREDGYHELDMLMQSVRLGDQIELYEADELSLGIVGRMLVPDDGSNLILRAAEVVRAALGVKRGARILLRKHIPISAGLGGGSADAAATLVGLNRLWDLGLTDPELRALALQVGADVPFCVTGGLARAEGVGERLTPLETTTRLDLAIIKPTNGLSTPAVFGAYDMLAQKPRNPNTDAVARALVDGDRQGLANNMHNALQQVATPLRPEIATCIQAMEHLGALRAQMTGSGSAVIGLFESTAAAACAVRACARIWPHSFRTHTMDRGLSILSDIK